MSARFSNRVNVYNKIKSRPQQRDDLNRVTTLIAKAKTFAAHHLFNAEDTHILYYQICAQRCPSGNLNLNAYTVPFSLKGFKNLTLLIKASLLNFVLLPDYRISYVSPVKVASFKRMYQRLGSSNVCCNRNIMNIAKPEQIHVVRLVRLS